MASSYSVVVQRGPTYKLIVTWNDPSGSPIDLTGFSGRLHVADNLSNQTSLLEFNSAGGGSTGTSIVLGGTAGTVTVGLSAAATSALSFTEGVYSLYVSSSGGEVSELLMGSFVVTPGLAW